MEVTIGSSSDKMKTVRARARDLACPTRVNKENWLPKGSGQNYPDEFVITVNGNKVTAERTDISFGGKSD